MHEHKTPGVDCMWYHLVLAERSANVTCYEYSSVDVDVSAASLVTMCLITVTTHVAKSMSQLM